MDRETPALADLQCGVIARWQAGSAGLSIRTIEGHLRCGRWRQLYRGVYATFTGEPPRLALVWAASLRAGPSSALSHYTAAELDGLATRLAPAIHVTIPYERRLRIPADERGILAPALVVHRSDRLEQRCHPCRNPRRTRIEETTLDLTQASSDLEEAQSWLMEACARRLTTAVRLRAAMDRRPRMRWRRALEAVLEVAGSGVHSALEHRYVRRVEIPHQLPRAARQTRSQVGERVRYLDNLYLPYGVAVELDGQLSHPAAARWHDIHRDNASAATGLITLRYSWADVSARPCEVASEIGAVLSTRGWFAKLRRCGPTCRVTA